MLGNTLKPQGHTDHPSGLATVGSRNNNTGQSMALLQLLPTLKFCLAIVDAPCKLDQLPLFFQGLTDAIFKLLQLPVTCLENAKAMKPVC